MHVDKDTAIECLEIAHTALKSRDIEKCIRLLNKCQRMYPDLNPSLFQSHCALFAKYTSLDPLIQNVPNLVQQKTTSSQKHHHSEKSSSTSSSASRSQKSEEKEPVEGVDFTAEEASEVKRVLSVQSDYYKVLDIPRSADEAAVKKAYRKMAIKLHPDRNRAPHATEAFKIVSAAFVCLSDAEKKKLYDRYGTEDIQKIQMKQQESMFGGGGFGRQSPFVVRTSSGRHFSATEEEMFFDLFSSMFGGGMGPSPFMQPQRRAHHQQQQRRQQSQGGSSFSFQGCIQLVFVLIILFSSLNFSLFRNSDYDATYYRQHYYSKDLNNESALFAFQKIPKLYENKQLIRLKTADIPYFLKTGLKSVPSDLERQVYNSYYIYLSDRCEDEKSSNQSKRHACQRIKLIYG